MSLFGLSVVLSAIILIVLLNSVLKFNAFLSFFVLALYVSVISLPVPDIFPVLKNGLQETTNSVALIVIIASLLGVLLDVSKASLSIANYLLKITRKSKSRVFEAIAGFISEIAVYHDSESKTISKLNRSIASKSKFHPVVLVSVFAAMLYELHHFILPRAAHFSSTVVMGLDTGRLVLMVIFVSVLITLGGVVWVFFMSDKRMLSIEKTNNNAQKSAFEPKNSLNLPPIQYALLPLALPLLFVGLKLLIAFVFPLGDTVIIQLVNLVGEPVIAITLGLFAGFGLLLKSGLKNNLNKLIRSIFRNVLPVVITVSGGGLFVAVIKFVGINEQFSLLFNSSGIGLLIPFIIAFVLKMAQGSSTIAMISAVSIVFPVLYLLGFSGDWQIMLVVLSMGAGSMMVLQGNDSYVLSNTKISRIEIKDSLKVYSNMSVITSISTFVLVLLLSLINQHSNAVNFDAMISLISDLPKIGLSLFVFLQH